MIGDTVTSRSPAPWTRSTSRSPLPVVLTLAAGVVPVVEPRQHGDHHRRAARGGGLGQGLQVPARTVEVGPQRRRGVAVDEEPVVLAHAVDLARVPLAPALGAGAELRQAMALVSIGGVAFSSVLFLVACPVIYHLIEDVRERLHGRHLVRTEENVDEDS